MQRIYRAAGKVLVWLGDGEAVKVQPGLHLVCQIASKYVAKKEQEHPYQTKDTHGHDPKAQYTSEMITRAHLTQLVAKMKASKSNR
jgi:hypothetical protein